MLRSFNLPKSFPSKKILAVDIGGTLAKTAFYIPKSDPIRLDQDKFRILTKQSIPSKFYIPIDNPSAVELENGDQIYLKSFESSKIDEFIEFVKENNLVDTTIHATGGGAYKYQEHFLKHFGSGIKVNKYDEMASLVNGLSFVLRYANKPTFSMESSIHSINPSAEPSLEEGKHSPPEADSKLKRSFRRMETDESGFEFPLLLVSIGSGVSIIKVHNFNSFERVSGTMIGGGTLIGLSNLLTGNREFEKIIAKAQLGNNSKVDMLVKDIYGENSPFSLKGDLLASSFAKVASDQSPLSLSVKERYAEEDVLSSLVTMISFNIGQLAFY